MELSPHSLTLGYCDMVFGVWLGKVGLLHLFSFSALPPYVLPRLALKLFRGEPAITEFDWNFTPSHNSSPSFAQLVGSGLPPLLHGVHPGHG